MRGPATSSRLLVYCPASRRSVICRHRRHLGRTLNFGQGIPFRVEFRPGAQGGWAGDFIFVEAAQEQRAPLAQVTLTNNVLTFGFTAEVAEFRFTVSTEQPTTLSGRYQPPGETGWPATLRRSNPGGDAFLDDLWLSKSSVPQTGVNLIRNGDFESASKKHGWSARTMHSSAITGDVHHSGKLQCPILPPLPEA